MGEETNTILNGANGGVVRVALVYLYTGLAIFWVLGALGLWMRLSHAGVLPLNFFWYYRIMTLHGTGMIFIMLVATMGAVAAILSARVRLSAGLLWTAYVLNVAGVACVAAGTLGGFAAGWTMLYPLPMLNYAAGWPPWSTFAFMVGNLLAALALLAYSLALLLGLSRKHGSIAAALAWPFLLNGGETRNAEPPALSEIAGTALGLIGLVTVVAGAAALAPMFAQAFGLISSFNVLLEKNFMFLFGHTVANMNIYLAAVLVYDTLPRYAGGRHWQTTRLSALVANVLLITIFLPYPHHLYMDFAQPEAAQAIGIIGSWTGAMLALLVTIFGGLYLIYRSGLRWETPTILILAGLWGWGFGGIGAMIDASTPMNEVFHNTLWVVAHFHTYYLLGAAAVTWGCMYYLITELRGRKESRLSRLAAWLYVIGGSGFALMFFAAGAAGMPRRYAVPVAGTGERGLAAFASLSVVLLGLGLLKLTYDLSAGLGAAWRRTKIAG